MDGTDFESVIRNAISLGGDSDTIGAMAGAIAESFYGVPEQLKKCCDSFIPKEIKDVLHQFSERYQCNLPITKLMMLNNVNYLAKNNNDYHKYVLKGRGFNVVSLMKEKRYA